MCAFLEKTDYNRFISHPLSSARNGSPLPDHITPLVGYISFKQPDCFIWEAEYFKKGTKVQLGKSGHLARVLGFGGIGKNYVMMKMEELGRNLKIFSGLYCAPVMEG
jgi:hypothetical protein